MRALAIKLAKVGTVAAPPVVALEFGATELGLALTLATSAVVVIVWLVRLEGRINTQGEILIRLERHVERLAGGGE